MYMIKVGHGVTITHTHTLLPQKSEAPTKFSMKSRGAGLTTTQLRAWMPSATALAWFSKSFRWIA